MYLHNRMLTCRECGAQFIFTVEEQEFYANYELLDKPSLCPSCRATKGARPVEPRADPGQAADAYDGLRRIL